MTLEEISRLNPKIKGQLLDLLERGVLTLEDIRQDGDTTFITTLHSIEEMKEAFKQPVERTVSRQEVGTGRWYLAVGIVIILTYVMLIVIV